LYFYRDKRVVGVFVRFSCAASAGPALQAVQEPASFAYFSVYLNYSEITHNPTGLCRNQLLAKRLTTIKSGLVGYINVLQPRRLLIFSNYFYWRDLL
jgi:hypothetical protein